MKPRRASARWQRAPGSPPRAAPRSAGSLHIYLGAVPGAGKTHAMLAEGRRLAALGADVVIGLVETRGRDGLEQAAGGLELIPPRGAGHRGRCAGELDVGAILARRPAVALVDELAHTNAPGSLRGKRWQDVDELLRAGIDVATTLNVAHLADLHDAVEQITGIGQREFVPEAVVLPAGRIDFIDTEPRIVLRRLAQQGDPAGAGGLGLGLAIAKGFTDAMDGELALEDTPGGGATFVFSLRRFAPDARPRSRAGLTASGAASRPRFASSTRLATAMPAWVVLVREDDGCECEGDR